MDMLSNKSLWNQWAVLPLRLIIGFGFMVHGWAKWSRGPGKFGELLHQVGLPFPGFTAWVVTSLEFFGGMAILAGFLVAFVSIPLVMSMLVAMFTVQLKYGFSSINTIGLTKTGPVFGPPGYEINLLYVAALLVLALSNPTPLSVDRWLVRRRLKRAAGRDNN
jgi:putative oxidoreductase